MSNNSDRSQPSATPQGGAGTPIDRSEVDSPTLDSAQTGGVIVGIPVYNEAATIAEVVTGALAHADEVVVVDDGSDDPTRTVASAAGATVVVHEQNRGYGAALGTIFRYARDRGASQLVVLDGDGQHDIDDIPNLLGTQRETGAEIVTGSRFGTPEGSEVPAYRQVGLAVINLLTNASLRLGYSYRPISDTQCGFRAYDRRAVETLANGSDVGAGMGASLDILFEAAREGYEVAEVPTEIDYDVEDANTQNPVRHGLGLLVSLFVTLCRDRPFRIAALALGILLLASGVGLSIVQFGSAGVSVLAVVLFVLTAVTWLTLSKRLPKRSDSPER